MGIVCLGAALAPATPGSAASRFRAITGSCGMAIVDPKAEHPTFVLKNDIGPCSTDGIIFKASNVTLDLNGRTIRGLALVPDGPDAGTDPDGGYGEGVGIRLVGNSNVTIKNSKATGGVTDFDAGIVIQRGEQNPARGNVVRSVRVWNNVGRQSGVGGTACGDPDAETACEVSDFNDGISLVGAENSTIGPNNVVEMNGSGGIRVDDAVTNTITANTIQDNVGNGVRFMSQSRNNLVTGNLVQRNATGINFSFGNPDNIVENNTVTANRGFGVSTSYESERTIIRTNTVTNNRSGGINLTSGQNTVTGNQVLNNGKGANNLGRGNGIFVASGTDNFPRVGTTVSGNTVQGSGGNGIRVSCMVDQRDPTTEGGTYDTYGCLVYDTHNSVVNNIATGNAVNGPSGLLVKQGFQTVGFHDLHDSTNSVSTQSPFDPSGVPLTNCSNNTWSGNTFTTAYPSCTAAG